MLPDSPTLTALLAAATPGKWVWIIRSRRQSLRVMFPKDGCIQAYRSILETDGDHDGADYRGATAADRDLIALAPALAAEVIRLRATVETLSQAAAMATRGTITLNSRIKLALEILDDPADPVEGICRATEALCGESPVVPAQVGDAK